MYNQPKTDVVAVATAMNICRVSKDGNVRINNTVSITNQKIN